jgi:hypothetical protein
LKNKATTHEVRSKNNAGNLLQVFKLLVLGINEAIEASNAKGAHIELVTEAEVKLFHGLLLHSCLQPMASRKRYFFRPRPGRKRNEANKFDAPFAGTIAYPDLEKYGMSKSRWARI